MLFESSYGRGYIFAALESGPALMAKMVEGMSAEQADLRPDPERFTIREIIAHLADWDGIFLYRMRRMVAEDCPMLPGYEPDDLARENNYAGSDPRAELEKWALVRKEMAEFVRGLSVEQMEKTADRPEMGRITLLEQAILIPLHDTYHLIQVQQILS